jgi:2-polyprenyl-3-methyl-5-hydroxy-6-metoxy-1,4-benzoquinol methylase
MVKDASIQAIQWGEMEIAGQRHSYRESLLYSVFHRKLKKGKVLDAGYGSGSMVIKLLLDGYEVDDIEESQKFVDMVESKTRL